MNVRHLCESIAKGMEELRPSTQEQLKRVYSLTWTIAHLCVIDLAMPTEAARGRLEDLHRVIQAELASMSK